jgi:molybdopterin synthase sulfur carrier subunit
VAIVYLPIGLAKAFGGESPLKIEGATVREVLDKLEKMWPGVRERLADGDRLRPGISVAVDGVISPIGLLEAVSAQSEVHFVAAISGG